MYSMFVLVKGVSKEEAFRIGQEISERVTADNPKPIKLKFEKVIISKQYAIINTTLGLFSLHSSN